MSKWRGPAIPQRGQTARGESKRLNPGLTCTAHSIFQFRGIATPPRAIAVDDSSGKLVHRRGTLDRSLIGEI